MWGTPGWVNVPNMFDHVGIQVADVAASAAAYQTALAPIGLIEVIRHETPAGPVVGMTDESADRAPYFWLSPGTVTEPRHESHIAFLVPSRAAVDAVGAAAEAAGLEILHAPAEHPEYHRSYYGVFFRDLDGNNIEAVCHAR